VSLDFTYEFLGPPHLLGGLPLTQAGNPVVSLGPNGQTIRQGPAQSRCVSLGPVDQLADEVRLHKVMPPSEIRSSGSRGEISSLSKAAMAA
jgi:hypothetical protein